MEDGESFGAGARSLSCFTDDVTPQTQALNFPENKIICSAQYDFIGYFILFYFSLRECFQLLSLKENNLKCRSNWMIKGQNFPESGMFY